MWAEYHTVQSIAGSYHVIEQLWRLVPFVWNYVSTKPRYD